MGDAHALVVRRWSAAQALGNRTRLQAIFRDAVLAAGPCCYTSAQCAAWAATADDDERWTPWLVDGATWVAHAAEDGIVVGFGMACPRDYVHLLYVDPQWHRRGIALALLHAVEGEARACGVDALTADASLISHPVFAAAGYDVVEWQDVERRGQVFRRARMRKVLA